MSFILCLIILNNRLIQAFELNSSTSNEMGLHQHRLISEIIEKILKNSMKKVQSFRLVK
jgi:hypothetical protein